MAEQRKQRSRLWLWLGVVALLVAVFFTAHYMLRAQLPVRQAQAAYQDLSQTVSTNGRVEPEKTYAFFSPFSTTVKAVYVQEGDHVPAGKLLVQLDDTEALAKVAAAESVLSQAQVGLEAVLHNGTQAERQTAQAQVATYRLERTQAQSNLNAMQRLVQSGAASPSEVDAAKQRLEAAKAALKASEQNLNSRYAPGDVSQARAAVADAQANLAAARQTLEQTQIRAPIAGTVYDLEVKPTDFAEAGKQLLQMADLREERVRAYFDEPEIGALAVGQPVSVTWDAKPGLKWHGHLERTPITVERYETRTVGIALIHIDDTANSGLLPDTNVTVVVTTATVPHALTVPREAVYPESGHPVVYRILGGKLVRTPVTTGMFNTTQEQIVSGLQAGDWVATGSPTGQPLQDGIEVKVVQ
jgi:HlyD family secretion protein